MKNFSAWSRSRLEPEPESAPVPRTSGAGAGATQKSGGSATLYYTHLTLVIMRKKIYYLNLGCLSRYTVLVYFTKPRCIVNRPVCPDLARQCRHTHLNSALK